MECRDIVEVQQPPAGVAVVETDADGLTTGRPTQWFRDWMQRIWERTGGSSDRTGQELPTGSTIWHAASTPPDGYLVCDGREVSRSDFSTLFSVIGTAWGAGNGSTTFNLPDLQGRTAIGTGSGSGLTTRSIADSGGEESHQLIEGELPTHGHSVVDPGHTHSSAGAGSFLDSSGVAEYDGTAADTGSLQASTGSSTTGITIGTTGSNQPHENMPPFKALLPCIKS